MGDPVGARTRDLVAAVDRAARLWSDRMAWTFDPGESLTFADVGRRSTGLAAALAERGVAVRRPGRGDDAPTKPSSR